MIGMMDLALLVIKEKVKVYGLHFSCVRLLRTFAGFWKIMMILKLRILMMS